MLIGLSPLYNTLLVYIIMIVAILVIKPAFMYDYTENRFKSFGLANNETFFSFSFSALAGGVIVYLFFLALWTFSLKQSSS